MRPLSTYSGFSKIYDQLMEEAPYEEWYHFLLAAIKHYRPASKKVLDLGCGTGRVTRMMSRRGYIMTGVDLSEEMLAIAQQRILEEHLPNFPLIQQDMRELELQESFDIIYSFCDTLNYLFDVEDVQSTIERVAQHLEIGGLFLFDVHSLYKINHIYSQGPIIQEEEELSYIWVSEVDHEECSVDHHLHFFVQEEKDLYRRFYEIHQQKGYSIDQLKIWLTQANFEILSISADFRETAPTTNSERIFFIAKKLD